MQIRSIRSDSEPARYARSERAPRRSGHRSSRATLFTILLICAAAQAQALSFQADFRSSTYQTQAGDSFSDLLAQHQSETLIQSTVTTGLEDISTAVYAGGIRNDYSLLMTATLDVGTPGSYTFQVGTDWGRGGATALVDNADGSILSERVITDDVWWGNSWSNPDVFTTTFTLQAGDSYTLMWVGFEGCCGGTSTIRFSVDGGAFNPLTTTNLTPYTPVPEPNVTLLLGLGLLMLAVDRTGRKRG